MAGPGGPGTVIVPWYATGFRADSFGAALNEIAPVALRYGASSYAVYRLRDDHYKFQQLAAFEDLLDWERYWEGPEMTDFRVITSGWCQVPVLYGWWDLTAGGALVSGEAPDGNGHGDGRGNGWGRRVASGRRAGGQRT
jgi:hypothetical protein